WTPSGCAIMCSRRRVCSPRRDSSTSRGARRIPEQLFPPALHRYKLQRMNDAELASEAARTLAKLRWGPTVVTRAVETLAQRSGELTADQRTLLAKLAA